MTTRFDAIDLGSLSIPDVIETVDYETLLQQRKDKAVELFAKAGIMQDWDPSLESDPIVKQLEEAAFREMILRQRINDAARACMLAEATGADLEGIAARYHVARQTIEPGDHSAIPPVEPVMESNSSLQTRTLLSFEALSVAGPEGAYKYHALSADPLVSDVDVDSPAPVEVVVTVMTNTTTGVPDQDVLDNVLSALTDNDVRPFTDKVSVQAASAIDYAFQAVLTVYGGPDAEVVRTASEESLGEFVAGQQKLGEPITVDGLHKAARVAGVKKVALLLSDGITPFSEITPTRTQFPRCTGFSVQIGGEE